MAMRVRVVGGGVAGLVTALELTARGALVEVIERADTLGSDACSWCAGGMLSPWCEGESAGQLVARQGQIALQWWPRHFSGTVQQGTLVVASGRDASEVTRFARRTSAYESLDADAIAALEPDLAGRFRQGLFFAKEAHVDPRMALLALAAQLREPVRFGAAMPMSAALEGVDCAIDCRGFSAREALPELRGVRGEMIIVRSRDISLARPVRLLHPRTPIYVVPRHDHVFMIGATMIESDHRGAVTARSAMELLGAAYALHPAFGEAEVLELRADVRPAFPDNLPRATRQGRIISLNGLFRHGFLLSPAYAQMTAELAMAPVEA